MLKKISLVIPVYNEEEVLKQLLGRVVPVLEKNAFDYELIFVNDGSRDRSLLMIKDFARKNKKIKVVSFSRNFGHQIALSAGLNFTTGEVVMVIDADLQDPPELLPKMIEKWQAGYKVVYGVRKKRKEGIMKKICYGLFYRLLKNSAKVDIPLDAGDFCLMDRKVVVLINSFPERTRFLRGLRSWIGFSQIGIEYDRDKRYAGKTKYSFIKLIKLAIDGFVSFSDLPLKLAMILGFFISFLSIVYAIIQIFVRFVAGGIIPGWATITVAVLFLGGVQLIMIGVVLSYLSKIFNEVKGRPLFIIDEILGFENESVIKENNTTDN